MWKEFKEFAIKGNAFDLAVGVVIGAAFGQIVTALVNDIIMPPLGVILGKIDFSKLLVNLPGGSQLLYGAFINVVLNFLIVALAVFLIVKQINRFKKAPPAPEPTEKECPFCKSMINKSATRCPNCTSQLA